MKIEKLCREPISALTHFIGFLFAIPCAVLLIYEASKYATVWHVVSLSIFGSALMLLYAASSLYHMLPVSEKIVNIFRKIDHMMIFVLIAGSYTPVCLLVLGGRQGVTLLAVVWGIAAAGILIKALWITCPKWFSSLLYICMGWVCVAVFGTLFHTLPPAAFLWLLAGGIIYTAGGIIYALKLPIFNQRHKYFGSHEIFHLFVMGGSICHFIFMYVYVA